MKVLFFGDSITDMNRDRDKECYFKPSTYGNGYVFYVAGDLYSENPKKYTVVNSGISGNRVVDLYARIKGDMWEEKPDVLSILIGINDLWHEMYKNGIDIVRFEKVYRMIIEDTRERFPYMKIILMEPFVLHGTETDERYDEIFAPVFEYAKVVKKLAEEYGLFFLPLQEKLNEKAEKWGGEYYLYDGVHPNLAGARLIADEWLKLFKEKVDK